MMNLVVKGIILTGAVVTTTTVQKHVVNNTFSKLKKDGKLLEKEVWTGEVVD